MSKRMFWLVSHDLTSEIYWTGNVQAGQFVATRDPRRAALFDCAWKAYAAADRCGDWLDVWQVKRLGPGMHIPRVNSRP